MRALFALALFCLGVAVVSSSNILRIPRQLRFPASKQASSRGFTPQRSNFRPAFRSSQAADDSDEEDEGGFAPAAQGRPPLVFRARPQPQGGDDDDDGGHFFTPQAPRPRPPPARPAPTQQRAAPRPAPARFPSQAAASFAKGSRDQNSLGGLEEEEIKEEETKPDRLTELLGASKFDCNGKKLGYYADVGLSCAVFHYCADGVRHSWMCPEGQGFHQIHLICMPEGGENICSQSQKYHFVNDYLYKPINEGSNQENETLRYYDRFYPEELGGQGDFAEQQPQQHQPQQQQQQQPQRRPQQRPATSQRGSPQQSQFAPRPQSFSSQSFPQFAPQQARAQHLPAPTQFSGSSGGAPRGRLPQFVSAADGQRAFSPSAQRGGGSQRAPAFQSSQSGREDPRSFNDYDD